MNKYIPLLILFFIASCAIKKQTRTPSSLKLIKSILISQTQNRIEINRNIKKAFKIKLTNIFNKPVKDQYVKVQLISGESAIEQNQEYTDSSGELYINLITKSKPENIKIRVLVGLKVKESSFSVHDNLIYEGSISEHYTQIKSKINKEMESMSEQLISLIPYDNNAQKIKNYKSINYELYLNKIKVPLFVDFTQDMTNIKFKTPNPSKSNLKLMANGQNIIDEEVFIFDTISKNNSKTQTIENNFILQLLGEQSTSLFQPYTIAVEVIGQGTVEYRETPEKQLKYTFIPPPEASGKSKIRVTINSKLIFLSENFVYNTKSPSSELSKWELSKKVLNADSYDFLTGSFTLSAKDGSPITINETNFTLTSPSCKECIKILKTDRNQVDFKFTADYSIQEMLIEFRYRNKFISSTKLKQDLSFKSIFSKDYKSFMSGISVNGITNSVDDFGKVVGYSFYLSKQYIDQDHRLFSRGGQERSYQIENTQQSSKLLYIDITDTPTEFLSHNMHSHIYLFPRKHLFQAKPEVDDIRITLPNDELFFLNKKLPSISGGVFQECSSIHMGKDITRHKRHWPQIKYSGKGLVIRVNARGQFPELSNWNKTKISNLSENSPFEEGFDCLGNIGHIGAEGVYIYNGTTEQHCIGKKSEFWSKTPEGGFIFKFDTDEKLDEYLKEKCGFGVPQINLSE